MHFLLSNPQIWNHFIATLSTARLFRDRGLSVLMVPGAGLNVLGDEKAMAVVGKLVTAQANVFAKASLDPVARRAAREAAMEAVTGSYVSLPQSPPSERMHAFDILGRRCSSCTAVRAFASVSPDLTRFLMCLHLAIWGPSCPVDKYLS